MGSQDGLEQLRARPSNRGRWLWAGAGAALLIAAVGYAAVELRQRAQREQALQDGASLIGSVAGLADSFIQIVQGPISTLELQQRAAIASAEFARVVVQASAPPLQPVPGLADAVRQHALSADILVRSVAAYTLDMNDARDAVVSADRGRTEAREVASTAAAMTILSGHIGPIVAAAEAEKRAKSASEAAVTAVQKAEVSKRSVAEAAAGLAEATRSAAALLGASSVGRSDYDQLAARIRAVDVQAAIAAAR